MGGWFPSPPASPDYAAAATAQGAANKETAIAQSMLNNPNMYTPYGNQIYSGGEGGERPTLTQTLSPEEQAKLQSSNALQLQSLGILQEDIPYIRQALVGPFGLAGGPLTDYDPRYAPGQRALTDAGIGQAGPVQRSLDYSGAPAMPVADASVRDAVAQSTYNQMAHFLDPQFSDRENALRSDLANQGITRGSEAYDREQRNLELARESAYGDLMNRAVMSGGDAMNQLYNMAMTGRQQGVNELTTQGEFGNTAQNQVVQQLLNAMQASNAGIGLQSNMAAQQAGVANSGRNQAYNEYSTNRTMPINMLSALLSSSQVNNPSFQSTQPSMIQPAPIFQGAVAQDQANTGRYNAQMGLYGSLLSGLGSAAGGWLGGR